MTATAHSGMLWDELSLNMEGDWVYVYLTFRAWYDDDNGAVIVVGECCELHIRITGDEYSEAPIEEAIIAAVDATSEYLATLEQTPQFASTLKEHGVTLRSGSLAGTEPLCATEVLLGPEVYYVGFILGHAASEEGT